jgi:hypothetical protein
MFSCAHLLGRGLQNLVAVNLRTNTSADTSAKCQRGHHICTECEHVQHCTNTIGVGPPAARMPVLGGPTASAGGAGLRVAGQGGAGWGGVRVSTAVTGDAVQVTIDFEPFKPINTSLYLCDNKFHVEVRPPPPPPRTHTSQTPHPLRTPCLSGRQGVSALAVHFRAAFIVLVNAADGSRSSEAELRSDVPLAPCLVLPCLARRRSRSCSNLTTSSASSLWTVTGADRPPHTHTHVQRDRHTSVGYYNRMAWN